MPETPRLPSTYQNARRVVSLRDVTAAAAAAGLTTAAWQLLADWGATGRYPRPITMRMTPEHEALWLAGYVDARGRLLAGAIIARARAYRATCAAFGETGGA